MKKCNKCQEIKSFDCFQKDRSKKDGYSTICKLCRKAYKELPEVRDSLKSVNNRTKLNLLENNTDCLIGVNKSQKKVIKDITILFTVVRLKDIIKTKENARLKQR